MQKKVGDMNRFLIVVVLLLPFVSAGFFGWLPVKSLFGYAAVSACPAPYHIWNEATQECTWSCAIGTVPDTASLECVCRLGFVQAGYDQFDRRVCTAPATDVTDDSTVMREIYSDSAGAGDTVLVQLQVFIDNDISTHYVYAIEETIPQGWQVTEFPDGATVNNNVLRIAALYTNAGQPMAVESTTYSYRVKPTTPGTGSFSGQFVIDGLSEIGTIGGDSSIAVTGSCRKLDTDCDNRISDMELLSAAEKWLQNQITDNELLEVAMIWLG
jgi:hypothetical protein